MTRIEILKKDGNIVGYLASGHSGYAQNGEDIVCSAISSTMQMTLAGLQEIVGVKTKFAMEEDAFLSFRVDEKEYHSHQSEVDTLMKTLYLFLNEISKQYPKFIKLVEKEEK